jgi:hypothetical protein
MKREGITKKAVVDDIARLIGVNLPHFSTGSTEPRTIFDQINQELGLGINQRHTKPEMAREIVLAAGFHWNPSMESSGGTVTLEGLLSVREAVELLVKN